MGLHRRNATQKNVMAESDDPKDLQDHRPRKSGSLFNRVPRLLLVLTIYWWCLVHYMEKVRPHRAMNLCQWHNWEHWDKTATPHRVAFIADPQLVDDHTYPTMPRWLYYLVRKMSDNYLHINYKHLQSELNPNTTIFIGDLFDGGREWEDQDWEEEFRRFNRIFPENPERPSYRGLPGNHDIGFQNISLTNVERFAAHFGAANDVFELGNHTFIQLDTISLSHPDDEVNKAAREFFEARKAETDSKLPKILLTHVPLYRDPNAELCGPGRETTKRFPIMRGHQYQTVIEFYPWTEDILKKINPILVFSGDDHDFCDVTHVDYADNSRRLAREISCKTFSMTNGIKRPAVQLLSLYNPADSSPEKPSYETTMCYLPRPYLGAQLYVASMIMSIISIYVLVVRYGIQRDKWKVMLADCTFIMIVAAIIIMQNQSV